VLTDPGIPAGAEARLYFQPFTARLKRLRKKLASLKGHGFSRAASGPNAEPALAAEGMQAIENRFPRGLKPRTSFTQPVAWLKPRPFKAAKLPDRRPFSAAALVAPQMQRNQHGVYRLLKTRYGEVPARCIWFARVFGSPFPCGGKDEAFTCKSGGNGGAELWAWLLPQRALEKLLRYSDGGQCPNWRPSTRNLQI
jgi:hypothetical protein